MRIRKRQLPLPAFSSLSDPPVQLHLPSSSSSSDPPINPLDNNNQKQKLLQQYDSRETILIGAETINNALLPHSSSSSQVGGGRWCEKEKAFPLKKRRGSFERSSDEDNDDHNKDIQVATKLQDEKKMIKTKMNKKCTLSQKQSKVGLDIVVGKKRSRGGALMEGSRCSRVNGRGWRCCQQTLVGYSLCEHHLGKGRLRSMNNVRNRSLAAATPKNIVVIEKDEKKPSPSQFPSSPPPPSSFSLTNKKRMKLGVVKARSISSLLGQPDGIVATPLSLPSTLHDDNIDK
ncbi:uncharacterized protein LOC103486754 isoform X2 [Cucumis melo]|uniref:Uncharacterized protein LOC103486754 isoform X2 n=1 Tax=Cucumis melo TaxID=3656 RepID=A0A1S3B760_CUCME|nr:uncharacterized protein LOC103486754 isoform X2 [Cucumis melo]